MKNSIKFESHGRGCSDILLNGERVGGITGGRGMYYVCFRHSSNTTGRDTAVARFKYMNPVSKAKNFVRAALKHATPDQIVNTLGPEAGPDRPTPLGWLETLQSR
jgi:hypothetical protein